jgi:ketosteroid isomerase-like protein
MKKSVILNLSLAVLVAILVCGCQTAGPSDEQLVSTTMADWKASLIAEDLDRLMTVYSMNYISTRGSGKDSMREFMTGAFESDFMDNVEINIEDAKIIIEGDKAAYGPVEFVSDRGTFVLEYKLRKEEEAWLIVGSTRLEQ